MPNLHHHTLRQVRRDGQEGKDQGSDAPYLFIRYRNNDTDLKTFFDGRDAAGKVVTTTTDNFYTSPDITFNPADKDGNAVEGSTVTVKAIVFNGGLVDATGVLVEFFWFTAAFAIVPGNEHPIGGKGKGTKLVTVLNHNHADVECPDKWHPEIIKGIAHDCLVVQCSYSGEGANGLKFPLDSNQDRHVAQKNVSIAPSGTPLELHILAPNPFATAAGFTIRLSSIMVRADLEVLRSMGIQAAMALVANATVGQESPTLDVTDVTEKDFQFRVEHEKPSRIPGHHKGADLGAFLHDQGRAAPDLSPDSLGKVLKEFSLDQGEMLALDITGAKAGTSAGHFLVHRMTQTVEGMRVGGYAVVIAPPDFP